MAYLPAGAMADAVLYACLLTSSHLQHKASQRHRTQQLPARPVTQVIMYDEPTAGLDPVASTVVEDLIRSMHSSPASGAGESNGAALPSSGIASYIVVTHQHSTIRRAVDRIIFLHEVAGAVPGADLLQAPGS